MKAGGHSSFGPDMLESQQPEPDRLDISEDVENERPGSAGNAGHRAFWQAAATGLALVVHELATSSMKYGALSMPTGTLDLSSRADGEKNITLTWLEKGGPSVAAEGFGSKLVRRSVVRC